MALGDLPGGLVVEALPPNVGGTGSIPGQGAKIPYALWPERPNQKSETIW